MNYLKKVKVSQLFATASNKMNLDLEEARSAIVNHAPSLGDAAEMALEGILKKYLPQRYSVSRGFVIDSEGNSSKQIDVIISDAHNTPILYNDERTRLVPCECVYATIEVKVQLNKSETKKAFANMQSIRNLKTASHSGHCKDCDMYGRKWKSRPMNCFIFAFESVSLQNIKLSMDLIHSNTKSKPWNRIDGTSVLKKGLITNSISVSSNVAQSAAKIIPLPTSKSNLTVIPTSQSLLLFYSLLFRSLETGSLQKFDFTHYLDRL